MFAKNPGKMLLENLEIFFEKPIIFFTFKKEDSLIALDFLIIKKTDNWVRNENIKFFLNKSDVTKILPNSLKESQMFLSQKSSLFLNENKATIFIDCEWTYHSQLIVQRDLDKCLEEEIRWSKTTTTL